MTKYEFCWAVSPTRRREWDQKLTVDDFEVEISGDRILMRTKSSSPSESEIRTLAEGIRARLVRAMQYHEGQRLTSELSYLRSSPPSGPEEIGLAPRDRMEMRDDARTTMYGYAKLDATLVKHSDELKLQDILQDFARLSRRPSLERMFDLITEFRSDPEKKLAPLYDILEIVETEFGSREEAANGLKIPFSDLEFLRETTCHSAILTGRHPGQAKGPQRAITDHELYRCTQVAEAIIREYAKQIPV